MSSRCCKVTSRCQASPGQSRPSLLLYLPEELSNHIYDYVAHSSKEGLIFSHDFFSRGLLPCPRHATNYDPSSCLFMELAYKLHYHVYHIQRTLRPLLLSGAGRKSIFRVDISGCLTSQRIQASVKQLTESTAAARTPNNRHFNKHGILFAWLAKQYRHYSSDAEQRFWEKIYWAFAGATEEIDGIRMRAFGMETLELPGGGFALV
ncbi:hypothetical protein D0869_03557 [Hortaea werneckii]|uniref:Uncharacterized protein n=1 Tax=Hortaea werneckii TaxID=91943 RepID=A0A3M6X4S6_HORWE|nr:hypothetical protein D0869_03557 [Hortaea werneckii]